MKQPEALRLADELRPTMPAEVLRLWAQDSASELRRLHEVNAELLEALKQVTTHAVSLMKAQSIARTVIAKAQGGTKC